ncbi:hypothetical protein ABXS75_14225 [Roseburia hominis]
MEEKWYDYFIVLEEEEEMYQSLEKLGIMERKRIYDLEDIPETK